ncbi:hypothetical protein C4K68_12370 [Pokkaliibacter plantistimulans]|uniref:Uncharacterized protein n=1 Tax=Proteobacteria bacterium 228 TaxID=2083153 RepID=A0A2S5KQR8_9PROT|nr:hypothetical protein [Pokkaliibacter plantistimulans]PPC77197.1 hypothetical protein C4K68_12370 [Pokkaliibacter plantistimulans]
MEFMLNPEDKYALQQQFRRAVSFNDRLAEAEAAHKHASEGRWWIMGIIAVLFAFHSDVFLGMSLAFFFVHFFVLFREKMALGRLRERKTEIDWWFHRKGLNVVGLQLFSERDARRSTPLDPFNDVHYSA